MTPYHPRTLFTLHLIADKPHSLQRPSQATHKRCWASRGIMRPIAILVVVALLTALTAFLVATHYLAGNAETGGPEGVTSIPSAGEDLPGESREVGAPEPLKIALIESGSTRFLRPIEYYRLENGTIVKVERYNPFPFKITLASNVSLDLHADSLAVYRVYFASTPEEVVKIASRLLGIQPSSYEYNDDTSTYIIRTGGGSVVLEYTATTGFFRITYMNPQDLNPDDFMAKRVKPLVAPQFTYEAKAGIKPSKTIGSTTLERSKVYIWILDGIPTTSKIVFKLDENERIVGIEGVIPLSVEEVGVYNLISLNMIPQLLSERVSGKINSSDWYITKLGFTSLTITSIKLVYKVTPENYLVPVYSFEGEWELEYGGIQARGSLEGLIVAVTSS